MISTLVASTIGTVAFLGWSPAHPQEIPLADWSPLPGDHLIVDTQSNHGYLMRADRSLYTAFPVITGQKRVVRYIGLTYNAATPDWSWVMQPRQIKGDRITYGPSGRFFRLFRNGTDYTHYGIHEHRSEQRMFGEVDRYQSMGCIIVRSAVLDLLEQTYRANGETLHVVTQAGIGPDTVAKHMQKEA